MLIQLDIKEIILIQLDVKNIICLIQLDIKILCWSSL